MLEEIRCPHTHGDHIHTNTMYSELTKTQRFSMVAEVFKQLGDPTRVRLFWLLSHQEECVINLSALLDMSSPAVSHHLRSLQECGLIESRRQGKEVFYRVRDTQGCRLLHKTVEQVMEIACPEKEVDGHTSPEDVVHIVHEHLLDHLDVRTTIQELSQKFLINPTTLKETFKQVYGSSIAAHMNEHRMELAASLLVSGSDSVEKIARTVGYDSQSRFAAVFKQTYGLSPSAYRKEKTGRP